MHGPSMEARGSIGWTSFRVGTPENLVMSKRRRSFWPLVGSSELEGRVVLSGVAPSRLGIIKDVTAHIREASRVSKTGHDKLAIGYLDSGAADPPGMPPNGTMIRFPGGSYLVYNYPDGSQWTPQAGQTPPDGSSFDYDFKNGAEAQGVWSDGRFHEVEFTGPPPPGIGIL